jgi:hypothetical protein
MHDRAHAQPPQQASPFDAAAVQQSPEERPVQLSPDGNPVAHDGARADAGTVAPLFSHFAEGAAAGAPVQMKEKLPTGDKGFEKMWAAHPHNYQEDESENTESVDLLESLGFDTSWNTCATRLSVMLNEMGYTITPAKTKAAGIARRPTYSKKTKQYYIIAASEMWTYLTANFRAPDQVFPARGRFDSAEKFDTAFSSEIQKIVSGKRGIVAFDKLLTGYTGTGHVDLFNGEQLSDANMWYPCQKLRLWYI